MILTPITFEFENRFFYFFAIIWVIFLCNNNNRGAQRAIVDGVPLIKRNELKLYSPRTCKLKIETVR